MLDLATSTSINFGCRCTINRRKRLSTLARRSHRSFLGQQRAAAAIDESSRPSHASQTPQRIGAASIDGCQTLSLMPCLTSAPRTKLPAVHSGLQYDADVRIPAQLQCCRHRYPELRYEPPSCQTAMARFFALAEWIAVLLCPNPSLIPSPSPNPVQRELCRLRFGQCADLAILFLRKLCSCVPPNQGLASHAGYSFPTNHTSTCVPTLTTRPDCVVPI